MFFKLRNKRVRDMKNLLLKCLFITLLLITYNSLAFYIAPKVDKPLTLYQSLFPENKPQKDEINILYDKKQILVFLKKLESTNNDVYGDVEEWKHEVGLFCFQKNLPLMELDSYYSKSSSDKKKLLKNAKIYDNCYEKILKIYQVVEKNVKAEKEKENIKVLITQLEELDQRNKSIIDALNEKSYINKFKDELYDNNIATENIWYAAFHLGLKLMPEYDDEGNNEGFQESNFFGRLTIDTRFDFDDVKRNNATQHDDYEIDFLRKGHAGINIDFLSANIVNCDKLEGDQETECNDNKLEVEEVNFNDISNTVNTSVYIWDHFLSFNGGSAEFAFGGRYGMQSRAKKKENDDSINKYYTYGLRFVYNDFIHKKGRNYKNGMPRFFLEVSKAEFEDFAGLNQKAKRTIITGAYRITDNSPIYIGMYINGGKGPDEIALTFTYGVSADRLFGL
jgi:hypothetical protein